MNAAHSSDLPQDLQQALAKIVLLEQHIDEQRRQYQQLQQIDIQKQQYEARLAHINQELLKCHCQSFIGYLGKKVKA